MKTVFCLLICFLSLIFPSQKFKAYCEKIADETFIITEPNKENLKSVAVQVFSK